MVLFCFNARRDIKLSIKSVAWLTVFAALNINEASAQNLFGKSGPWNIVKYDPGGCVAQIVNLDGAVLSLRRSPNGIIGIAFEYNRLAIPPGRYPYEAMIGGPRLAIRNLSLILIVTADAPTRGISVLDESTFDLLKEGSWISFKLGSKNYHFNFDDTANAVSMSKVCEGSERDPFAIQSKNR